MKKARISAANRKPLEKYGDLATEIEIDFIKIETLAMNCSQWDASTYHAFYETLTPDVVIALLARIRKLEAERESEMIEKLTNRSERV